MELEHFLEDLLEGIRVQRQRIAACAEQLADEFWQVHYQVRATKPRSQWGRLGVRVRMRGEGVPYIEWYRNTFRNTGGKRRVISRHFTRGKRVNYSRAKVRPFAQDWELLLFDDLEPKFARLRKDLQYLATIYRHTRLKQRHDGQGTDGNGNRTRAAQDTVDAGGREATASDGDPEPVD